VIAPEHRMQSGSYVVHLVGCDDPIPFKHFGVRADAVAYGQSRVQSDDAERADVYLVDDATDARAAIAAFQMGRRHMSRVVLTTLRKPKSRPPTS